jgi:hypothetical protein
LLNRQDWKLFVHALFPCTMPATKFWPSLSVNSKKKIVICTLLSSWLPSWLWTLFFGWWILKLKIILSFLLHRTFTAGYLCTIALILFIHVGFLGYLSFKRASNSLNWLSNWQESKVGLRSLKVYLHFTWMSRKWRPKFFGRHSTNLYYKNTRRSSTIKCIILMN